MSEPKLDKNRPYGEIYGTGENHIYEQDDMGFDGMGRFVCYLNGKEPEPETVEITPKKVRRAKRTTYKPLADLSEDEMRAKAAELIGEKTTTGGSGDSRSMYKTAKYKLLSEKVCEICGKKLNSANGWAAHVRFKHGREVLEKLKQDREDAKAKHKDEVREKFGEVELANQDHSDILNRG